MIITPDQEAIARQQVKNIYSFERAHRRYCQGAGHAELDQIEAEMMSWENSHYLPMLYRIRTVEDRIELEREMGIPLIRRIGQRSA